MIVAILQARASSSRLPGKVLRPILGVPMLLHQIERVSRAQKTEKLVVATSTDSTDDDVDQLCRSRGIPVYRGSLDNVLDRYYWAARQFGATSVVRLTGDCPLADPGVIDRVIGEYLASGVDYASNALNPTYPDGLDVEIFRFDSLARAWREARLPSEREHVTLFINRHPELFRILSVTQSEDMSSYRWTVDTAEDFDFVSRIYESLYPANPAFGTADIVHLLHEDKDLLCINKHIDRNEGLKKSLEQDQEFLCSDGEESI